MTAPPRGRDLPGAAYAAALSSLPGMGFRRLRALLARWPDPAEAWRQAESGRALHAPEVAATCHPSRRAALAADWRAAAVPELPRRLWTACEAAGIGVATLGSPGYPVALAADHEAPAVLFHRGELAALDGPRVAIVGTRRCTRYGREVARELGADLASAGVRVVSGLALGIDGAAHEGALAAGGAPPAAVVGSGLDRVYPRRHRSLWDAVATAGVLLGEAPPGAEPEGWRFPLRNRVIAGLAQVVVVVESHLRGGSRHTVDAALERGIDVMAVPGSVRSPASAGTNDLLATGVPPARDASDVLVALGLAHGGGCPTARRDPGAPPRPSGDDALVLDAAGWEPTSVDQIVLRSGLSLPTVAVSLAHLERDGWLGCQGPWWERLR